MTRNFQKKVVFKYAFFFGMFLCVVFTTVVSLVAFTPLPNVLARPLGVKPVYKQADVILVLSGGVYPNGSLSYFTSERVVQAVALYRRGFASKMILSGGLSLGNETNLDAEAMKRVVIELGVEEEDIIIEDRSRNTYENMKYSKLIIDEMGFKEVLLVTSAIHTFRSLEIGKDSGLNLIPASPEPFEEYREVPIDRLLLFYFTAREYGALLLYRLSQ